MHVRPLDAGIRPTQVAIALQGQPGLVWLDGDGAGDQGRYSFVGCHPMELRTAFFGDRQPLGLLSELDVPPERGEPAPDPDAPHPARVPWWVGFVAYDAAWSGRTRTPARLERRREVPMVRLGRYDAVFAFDHHRERAWIVGDNVSACERLRQRIEAGREAAPPKATVGEPVAEPAGAHERAIAAALEHIAAGDIYQVNLARRWQAPLAGSPLALWLRMREASPVPLGLYAEDGMYAVLARTMERFVEWSGSEGGRLTTRPIKGTIARAGGRDDAEAEALRSDEKERAEHAMIVDLMRNDLGRVARTGTVEVAEQMAVEPYAKLSHLVSTVACETREGATLADIMKATFPPGSVTGAPKVRAIEIIEALERSPREVYTGTVGYVNRMGGASFAVAIRTAVVSAGQVRYHAGGGLVAASVPSKEVAETELKARVFLDAVAALR